jgi:hypothetical protein
MNNSVFVCLFSHVQRQSTGGGGDVNMEESSTNATTNKKTKNNNSNGNGKGVATNGAQFRNIKRTLANRITVQKGASARAARANKTRGLSVDQQQQQQQLQQQQRQLSTVNRISAKIKDAR